MATASSNRRNGRPLRLGNLARAAGFLVFVCSVVVRGSMTSRYDPNELLILYSDGPTYLAPARSLLDHGTFLNSRGQPGFHRTPGYPVFLAGLMVFVGTDLRMLMLAQALVLSAGPLFLYWHAKRIMPPTTAIIVGLIAAFSPWGAVLAGVPMSDGLFLTLITLIFLLMKITADTWGSRATLCATLVGLLTGAAVLVRPIWALVILIPWAYAFSVGSKRRGVWLMSAIIAVCAAAPVALWVVRNDRVAHFRGLSDIPGQTAWQYLAARVRAEASGRDRHEVSKLAAEEETRWGVPMHSQEADDERWRRANDVFRTHPFLTGYSFARSALEHAVHPSPDVLNAAKWNFTGDVLVLSLAWAGLLGCAVYGLWTAQVLAGPNHEPVHFRWLLGMSIVCLLLTLSSGFSFAAGSRLRGPLEAIVPMLSALGAVRITHRLRQGPSLDRR